MRRTIVRMLMESISILGFAAEGRALFIVLKTEVPKTDARGCRRLFVSTGPSPVFSFFRDIFIVVRWRLLSTFDWFSDSNILS
jgi:hypothetical protein